MYRNSRKYQVQVARLANADAAKERKRLEKAVPADRFDLPGLGHVIESTGCDSGTPLTLRIALYRSDRTDGYIVNMDGRPWQPDRVAPIFSGA